MKRLGEIEVLESKKLKRLRVDAEKTLRESAAKEAAQRAQLKKLDREIKSKKQLLKQVRKKRRILHETNRELNAIIDVIESSDANARAKLRRGMTMRQVRAMLGPKNIRAGPSPYQNSCAITGTYFLLFQGEVLTKVVQLGSKSKSGNIVENCSGASYYGQNIAR